MRYAQRYWLEVQAKKAVEAVLEEQPEWVDEDRVMRPIRRKLAEEGGDEKVLVEAQLQDLRLRAGRILQYCELLHRKAVSL